MPESNWRDRVGDDDEVWELTPIGLLGQETADMICLYLFRAGRNAIVMDKGQLEFVTGVKGGDKK